MRSPPRRNPLRRHSANEPLPQPTLGSAPPRPARSSAPAADEPPRRTRLHVHGAWRTYRLPLCQAPKPPPRHVPRPAAPSPASSARIFSSHLRSTRPSKQPQPQRASTLLGLHQRATVLRARPSSREQGRRRFCAARGNRPSPRASRRRRRRRRSRNRRATPLSPPAIGSSFSATCAAESGVAGEEPGRRARCRPKSAARSSPPR